MTSPRTTAFALWAGALLLYLSGLWIEPLRDWEEATYARIAHEMTLAGWQSWLHPTLWGAPYLNKPTFVLGLMALSFDLIGESAFAARLPAAVLTSATVPLLYLLALEVTGRRDRALWAGLVHLLLLPVLRHGRLAMLDGVATLGLVLALQATFAVGQGADSLPILVPTEAQLAEFPRMTADDLEAFGRRAVAEQMTDRQVAAALLRGWRDVADADRSGAVPYRCACRMLAALA